MIHKILTFLVVIPVIALAQGSCTDFQTEDVIYLQNTICELYHAVGDQGIHGIKGECNAIEAHAYKREPETVCLADEDLAAGWQKICHLYEALPNEQKSNYSAVAIGCSTLPENTASARPQSKSSLLASWAGVATLLLGITSRDSLAASSATCSSISCVAIFNRCPTYGCNGGCGSFFSLYGTCQYSGFLSNSNY